MQHRLTIDYGDDVLFSSSLTRDAFNEEARFLLAAKLYGVVRVEFGCRRQPLRERQDGFPPALPRVGVAISNLQPEDLSSEMEFMQRGWSDRSASRSNYDLIFDSAALDPEGARIKKEVASHKD